MGIAVCTVDKSFHKGGYLSAPLKKALKKHPLVKRDFAYLYGACIWELVKEDLIKINKLIICDDEDFTIVRDSLIVLSGYKLRKEKIISISGLRRTSGKNIKSSADNLAAKYRKCARNKSKVYKYNLNVVNLNLSDIKRLLAILEKKL